VGPVRTRYSSFIAASYQRNQVALRDAGLDISEVFKQLENLAARIGEPLDANIYHNDMPVAQAGQVITQGMIDRLLDLPPRSLRFSRTDLAHKTEQEFDETAFVAGISAEREQLAAAAGVTDNLSFEVRQMATKKVKEIFEACRYLTKLDLSATAELAANLINRAQSLQNTAFKLNDLRNHDEYTYFHSINTCVLATTLFQEYVRDEDELLELGIGMLLHDIGKSKIDLSILNKPGRLTEEEYAVMMRHVIYGYNLVKDTPELSPMAKQVVLNHHERLNGTGYTRGLTETQLSVWDMLGAVCDVFDAVTTNRVYRPKMDIHRAVSILIRGAGPQFHTRIVNHFLKGIGRFPVGTFVRLSNGETGIVTRVHSEAIALPMIKVLFGNDGNRYPSPRVLDLYNEQNTGIYIDRPLDFDYSPRLHTLIDANAPI
jgi:HD-GYP domain-containing protein (c-di-GMP phosphodiesterase class II)